MLVETLTIQRTTGDDGKANVALITNFNEDPDVAKICLTIITQALALIASTIPQKAHIVKSTGLPRGSAS